MRRAVLAVVVLLCQAAVPARSWAQSGTCTVTRQNLYVRDALDDLYLWYRELPEVDPARYGSPEAYLEAVRYRPLDTTFSYITSRASNDAFFSESQFIGLGLSTSLQGDEMRVLQVFDDSPAAESGLDRGARIVEIDGRPIAAYVADGTIGSAFGPTELGVEVRIAFDTRAGERRTATLQKRLVTIPTVSLTRVFDVDGRKVGYLFFRNFVRPSTQALDDAFAALREAGVTELILDLRYNGGGLVDVAVHLGSLIGGAATRDQVFAEYRHNDRNTRRDTTLRFDEAANALGLSRLVVIATRSSASASELVVNALRPFMPVTIVGDRTYGKPVGQYQLNFCDKVLAPVSFSLVNADGQGDYFDGLAADCAAGDDIAHDLGSAAEASLAEALAFVRTGACSADGTRNAVQRVRAQRPRLTGWASIVNAY